jgi:hypothetical protein
MTEGKDFFAESSGRVGVGGRTGVKYEISDNADVALLEKSKDGKYIIKASRALAPNQKVSFQLRAIDLGDASRAFKPVEFIVAAKDDFRFSSPSEHLTLVSPAAQEPHSEIVIASQRNAEIKFFTTKFSVEVPGTLSTVNADGNVSYHIRSASWSSTGGASKNQLKFLEFVPGQGLVAKLPANPGPNDIQTFQSQYLTKGSPLPIWEIEVEAKDESGKTAQKMIRVQWVPN